MKTLASSPQEFEVTRILPSGWRSTTIVVSSDVAKRSRSFSTMTLLAHSDSRVYPRATVWVPHRLSLRAIASGRRFQSEADRSRYDCRLSGRWRVAPFPPQLVQ